MIAPLRPIPAGLISAPQCTVLIRSFARAGPRLATTDPLDAAVIARCLAALHAELTPYVPVAVRLAEHLHLRDFAVAQAVPLGNQRGTIADPAMHRLVTGQVARLKTIICAARCGARR